MYTATEGVYREVYGEEERSHEVASGGHVQCRVAPLHRQVQSVTVMGCSKVLHVTFPLWEFYWEAVEEIGRWGKGGYLEVLHIMPISIVTTLTILDE